MNTDKKQLNPKQIEILKHASLEEHKGQFVGSSPDMDELVSLGLMKDIGNPPWCPDTFYEITDTGRAYLLNP